MSNFKVGMHDLYTTIVIFAMVFLGTVAKGGSVSKDVLLSAALAGAGAVIHTFHKGAS
ncbi:MAG TPA: hypothetical protein VFK47_17640 [Ktedonobacteraceae bacterium]|nr:hypothetical protein [Ktedonobacteraceae bacterium]